MIFSKSGKKFNLICLCMWLSLLTFASPLWASSSQSEQESSPPKAEKPVPPGDESHHRPKQKDCPCKRPFRRFTLAINSLKQEGLISSDDIKKIYDALMKIPPQTLDQSADKDLSAAEMLHKDKILTDEQYQKIREFLKQNPPKNN